jgi:hypothetical protein
MISSICGLPCAFVKNKVPGLIAVTVCAAHSLLLLCIHIDILSLRRSIAQISANSMFLPLEGGIAGTSSDAGSRSPGLCSFVSTRESKPRGSGGPRQSKCFGRTTSTSPLSPRPPRHINRKNPFRKGSYKCNAIHSFIYKLPLRRSHLQDLDALQETKTPRSNK